MSFKLRFILLFFLSLGMQACTHQGADTDSAAPQDAIPVDKVEFVLGAKQASERFDKPACELAMQFRNGTSDTVRINVTNFETSADNEVVLGGFTSFGIAPD